MSRKTSVLLAAACAASVVTSSASAMVVPIVNANMETSGGGVLGNLADGQDNYPVNNSGQDGWRAWANSANGNMLRMWNPSAIDRSSTQNNQFFDTSWGGVAPEGDQVIVVRTQSFDYNIYDGTTLDSFGNRFFNAPGSATSGAVTYDWQTDAGGVGGVGGTRDFEAATQQLADTFDPTARYKLTVQVGRLAEGTGPNYDGSGLNAGDRIDPNDGVTVLGTSTRFVNNAPALWAGYTVDLMAGGVTNDSGSSFSGWVYGTTDPNDPAYIGMIAQDNNTLALAQDTWGQSTVAYTPGVGPDLSALAGKPLVIRLSALENANHLETAAVAFDNVVLLKIVAGDTNEDGDIDDSDLGTSFANYTGPVGASGGKTWNDGDTDGDGDVDDSDLGNSFANYTGPLSPASVPEPTSLALLGLGGLLVARRRR